MKHLDTILIVDDESGPRRSLELILRPEFDVITAESGARALERLSETPVDLVLLDLGLTGALSGTETLREIRARGIDVEVLVVTGCRELEAAIECLRLGACDYIAKPYAPDPLLVAAEKACARRRRRRTRNPAQGEEFLAQLSHECRSPLHAIYGYTEILADQEAGCLSEDQQHALARIQSNSRRLLSYLEDLFFLAESELRATPSRPRNFAVRPWLEKVLKSEPASADSKGVEIEIQCDDDLTGHAHPETLERLVRALTEACAKSATPRTLRVMAKRAEGDSLELRLDPGTPFAQPDTDPEGGSRTGQSAAGGLRATLERQDPMIREVVRRAASRLDARIRPEHAWPCPSGLRIEVPRGADHEPERLHAGSESPAPAESLAL